MEVKKKVGDDESSSSTLNIFFNRISSRRIVTYRHYIKVGRVYQELKTVLEFYIYRKSSVRFVVTYRDIRLLSKIPAKSPGARNRDGVLKKESTRRDSERTMLTKTDKRIDGKKD